MEVDFSGPEAVLDGALFILFDENLMLLLVSRRSCVECNLSD